MCAINGVVGQIDGVEALLTRMNEATKHRGPDGTAVWDGRAEGAGEVHFGHNRLAIIDLSAAADQPMTDTSGRYTIVYNGEIYNYRELRKQLPEYAFRSAGDTEVILALFAKEGSSAFAKLHGMFAVAIWDKETQVLTLARDAAGIKPMYFARTATAFLFSSEVKGVLASGLLPRRIDREALKSYLRLRYVLGPRTLVEGIEKLPAGTWAQFQGRERIAHGMFNQIRSVYFKGSFSAASRTVAHLVDDAVAEELVSDRPLGIYLSGGLDSTILLDAASRVRKNIDTFSLRFSVGEHEEASKFNADADLAAQTALHYGTRHHEILFSEEDFLALIPKATRYLDQPVANATALAQLHLATQTRAAGVVVALAGEGGDELFGGYPRYRLSRMMDWYQTLVPAPLRTFLGSLHPRLTLLNTPAGAARLALFEFEKDAFLSSVVAPEFISDEPEKEFVHRFFNEQTNKNFTARFMEVDRKTWLVDEALQRADTMNMGAGVEGRVPLLNTIITAYAAALPLRWKVGFFKNKLVLRAAFAARLPKHILLARKRGFFSPTAKWLRRPKVLAYVREVLAEGFHPGTDALLNFPGVARMLDEHVSGKRYALSTLWTLVTLRVWAKELDVEL